MNDRLDPNTTLGYVALTVSNLDRSIAFYRDVLGFQVRRHADGAAQLGAGGADVVVLHENPAARRVRGTSGLYHFAVLVPARVELAKSLKRLAETQWPVQGFADHLVSEAIYLPDPDGNGIEIYRTDQVGAIVYRARENGGSIEESAEGMFLRDPFQNGIMLTAQPPGS